MARGERGGLASLHWAHLGVQAHHRGHGALAAYAGVGLAAALSWAASAGPGEAALIAAGVAAARGRLDIGTLLAVAWAGAMLGGVIGWLVGRHGGRRVVLAGRWMRAARERVLEHGNRFFDRYGLVAVYFAPSWPAGINAMRAARFLPANAVSALVWALLVGLGSYAIGPSISDVAQDVGFAGLAALILLAVGAVVARLVVRRRGAG